LITFRARERRKLGQQIVEGLDVETISFGADDHVRCAFVALT
jgi:hypothetical protein